MMYIYFSHHEIIPMLRRPKYEDLQTIIVNVVDQAALKSLRANSGRERERGRLHEENGQKKLM